MIFYCTDREHRERLQAVRVCLQAGDDPPTRGDESRAQEELQPCRRHQDVPHLCQVAAGWFRSVVSPTNSICLFNYLQMSLTSI